MYNRNEVTFKRVSCIEMPSDLWHFISLLRKRKNHIEFIIRILFDKVMVMASSLMLGLINDMRQDRTYKDQEQSLVFMAM